MKKQLLIALTTTSLLIPNLTVANEFPICQSDLVKQMKRFEGDQISVPRKLVTGNLKDYALQTEILCPWEVEADVNGDKQLDWIGIIQRNSKLELVAYLSASPKYKLQVLRTHQFFPEQSYLRVKKAKGKKNGRNKNAENELFEVNLNDNSRVYKWDGEKLKIIRSFTDQTNIKKKPDSNSLEIPRKRSNKR